MPRGRKSTDAMVVQYASTRSMRDRLRVARDGCLCERHEGVGENLEPRIGEPCWKAARQWSDHVDGDGCPTGRRSFHFDPPIDDWCQTCRQRQAYTVQLRAAVRDHASAKRAILQRGRKLMKRTPAKPVSINAVDPSARIQES